MLVNQMDTISKMSEISLLLYLVILTLCSSKINHLFIILFLSIQSFTLMF